MPYITNPGGRIVCVDDEKQYQKLLDTKGFKPLSKEEIKVHHEERRLKIEDAKRREEMKGQEKAIPNDGWKRGVYFASVAPGGKDGYGVASQSLFNGLKDLGIGVSSSFDDQKVGFLLHSPYSALRMGTPIKVLYTMFESTKIPDDWIDYLQAVDKVLVPSKWCQEVFKRSGIESDVIPLGYDDTIYKYVPRKVKDRRKEDFVFVHYNAFNIRKGFTEVFKAFTQEFEHDEPVKLILKTTLPAAPIFINPKKYPNIKVICEKYNGKQMMDLLEGSDCYVFPSRGEGFGMTPLEAMATGIPAIIPNAHGLSEYFDADKMFEVKVKEECPALYRRYKGKDVGKMVICDVDDLRKQMRYVYEHPDEAVEKGRMASRYVQRWTLKKTALMIGELVKTLYDMPMSEKKNKNVLELEQV